MSDSFTDVPRYTSGRSSWHVVLLAGLAAFSAFLPHGGPLRAQTPQAHAMACTAAGGPTEPCARAAVTSRALMGQVGLLVGSGAEIPGTASTLGTRVGGGPRLSFFARGAAVGISLPDPAVSPLADVTFPATALQAGAAVGLFDGFRIMPTVGGFLSTDVFAQGAFIFLPTAEGFGGNTQSLTTGLRVGILREGFTVPGISLSVARRFPGAVDFGLADEANPTVTVDPGVTSLRLVVGKDLYAVEVMGGVGWDEYSGGDAVTRVADGVGPVVITEGEMSGSRRLYFGSASMTFGIVLSLSVQAGWAEGFDPVPGYTGSFDPTGGTLFGWFSARLTL